MRRWRFGALRRTAEHQISQEVLVSVFYQPVNQRQEVLMTDGDPGTTVKDSQQNLQDPLGSTGSGGTVGPIRERFKASEYLMTSYRPFVL